MPLSSKTSRYRKTSKTSCPVVSATLKSGAEGLFVCRLTCESSVSIYFSVSGVISSAISFLLNPFILNTESSVTRSVSNWSSSCEATLFKSQSSSLFQRSPVAKSLESMKSFHSIPLLCLQNLDYSCEQIGYKIEQHQ